MNHKDFDFEGKTVLITGAATGIGRATALAFAERGAAVVIGDVDPRAEETVSEITSKGGKAVFRKTDVGDHEQVKALVDYAVQEFGRLDVAFNNAGILPPTAPLAEQTIENWHKIMTVDVSGVFYGLKYEIEAMLSSGGGAIINTSSVAGLIADPGMAPYAAAKHAVAGLTKAAGLDYASQGIRVNAIAPGLVRTPMTERWLNDPDMSKAVLGQSPMGRAAEPAEIAGLVMFLASDLAATINGVVYPVDGGQTAH